MTPHDTLLCQAYHEEAERYAEALKLAEQLADSLRQGALAEDALQRLVTLLEEVALLETRIAPVKESWNQAGTSPSPELREVLARVAELIQRLAACVNAAEQEAVVQKGLLAPKLDGLIRSRQMQQAYGGVMSASTGLVDP